MNIANRVIGLCSDSQFEEAYNNKLPNDKKLSKSILKQKKVLDKFDKRILDNEKAINIIAEEIKAMAYEIEQSEAGSRSNLTVPNPEDGKGAYITYYTGKNSTFPNYLQEIFDFKGSKATFFSAIRGGKSSAFSKIVKEALNRIYHGYRNDHDQDGPNDNFFKLLKGEKEVEPKDDTTKKSGIRYDAGDITNLNYNDEITL